MRARAHNLDPVVSIAENGLTDAVLKEIEVSLNAHELIKIRVYGDDREASLRVHLVMMVGMIAMSMLSLWLLAQPLFMRTADL